ncbi:MAG: hypothetical protein ACLTKI_02480 [Lachnospiraceae bacterium]
MPRKSWREKQNLVRVNDILSELEKQVGPLARQSEVAREYLRLKETLKSYDVNLFLLESEEIRSRLLDVTGKEEIAERDLEQSRASSEQLKQEYDQLDLELAELEEQMTADREQRNKANLLKGNLEGQINVLYEQINTERMNAEHIQSRSAALQKENQEKEGQLSDYRLEYEELEQKLGEALRSQTEAETVLRQTDENRMLLDQKIESGKGTIIDTLNEKAELSARLQRYETCRRGFIRRSENMKLLKFKSDESVQELLKQTCQIG